MIEIEQLGDRNYTLGEGPLWDPREGALYWVDVLEERIWRHAPGTDEFDEWRLGDTVSAIALREKGGAIVTLSDGFFDFDFASGKCERIGGPVDSSPLTRFNDGKVDRQGRFIAGTMDNEIAKPLGGLYSLGVDRRVTKLDEPFTCSNGPCWSLDGRTLYFTDSMLGTIFAYDYAPDTGAATNRRVFADTRALLGLPCAPDGCTVDAEGFLWSAQCMGGKIARIAPDGSLDRAVDMPVKYVTSVMFGGADLDVLYVTSLSVPLLDRPPEEPNAGGLFAIYGLGAKGVPEPRFAG